MSSCEQDERDEELSDLNLVDSLREALSEANEELYEVRRRLREQLHIAARIHHRLLPTAIEHRRIEVDVRYLPADTLSGDYFQVRFPDDPSLCYITMCHVAGEGIAPVLLASRISSEARHYIEDEYCPSDMVHALNSFVYEHFHDVGRRISFIAARIRLDQRTVTYSGAGHPSGLLLRPGEGVVDRLVSQHEVLGASPTILFQESERTVQMAVHDRLFFYGGGLLKDTVQNQAPLEEDGLAKIATDAMSCELSQMLDVILDHVRQPGASHPSTDVAFVAAESK